MPVGESRTCFGTIVAFSVVFLPVRLISGMYEFDMASIYYMKDHEMFRYSLRRNVRYNLVLCLRLF